MKKFTPNELARFDGIVGAPTYIAYEGKVHGVSTSWQWGRGGSKSLTQQAWIAAAAREERRTGKICWGGHQSLARSRRSAGDRDVDRLLRNHISSLCSLKVPVT